MENILISVVIPVYNGQQYLARCLDSIFAQTYSNIEVIVVNDGSTDGTSQVIEQYKDKYKNRMKAIHIPNGGVTNARLIGARVAQGEWIGFVDSDDEIEPDMYEFLINNALKYKANISHCGYKMIFDDGRIHCFYNTGRLVVQNNITGIKDLLEGTLIEPSLCNKLFTKTLFHSLLHTNVMNTEIKINEDLLMNYYLFSAANKSVFEDICKYHYLIRSGSSTRIVLNKKKIYDPIRVKKIILDDAVEEIREDALRAYVYACIGAYSKLMLDRTNQFKGDESIIRKIIMEQKYFIRLLSKKQQVLAYMIIYIPMFYRPIYRFYVKYLLKSKYD